MTDESNPAKPDFAEVPDMDIAEAIKARLPDQIALHIEAMPTDDIVAVILDIHAQYVEQGELHAGQIEGWSKEVNELEARLAAKDAVHAQKLTEALQDGYINRVREEDTQRVDRLRAKWHKRR